MGNRLSGDPSFITELAGVTASGSMRSIASTSEGHLEVAIHAPRLPFGSVHVESLSPVFQIDAIYGVNTTEMVATTGTNGSAEAAAGLFTVGTGTSSGGMGVLQSRRRLRYRPGQGLVGRFTALWPSTVANSIAIAGLGTAESGFYFGYYNGVANAGVTSSEFGVLWVTGGVREIRTLTVTTGSTAANDYNIVLNSATAVNVTATSNSSTVKTAYEISRGTYPGWSAVAVGSTVVFLASSAGAKAGTFSLAQADADPPAAGTFAQTVRGVTSTDTFIPQSTWNGDKLDGTGASGVTLLPTKGNVFQIDIQYLGFGVVTFKVEVALGDNNADFVTVHTIQFPNTRTAPSVSQPAFPFTMAAYSAGSTTDVGVSVASCAGMVEGALRFTGPRMTYVREANNFVGSTASTYYPLFTVRNETVFNGRANQTVVHLISVAASHGDNTPVTLYLIRNATLAGTPNFAAWASSSCTSRDVAATTCTFASNDQLVFSLPMGNGSNAILAFEDDVTIQPGETMTLAARGVTGTTVWTVGNLNTREDQ